MPHRLPTDTPDPSSSYLVYDDHRPALHDANRVHEKYTVVLIHGWSGSRRYFDPVVERLRVRAPELRIIAYDHRFHGDSSHLGEASIAQLVKDLRRLLLSTCFADTNERIVLVGGSMGASLIWKYLDDYGKEVGNAQILGAVFIDQAPLQDARLPDWGPRFHSKGCYDAATLGTLVQTVTSGLDRLAEENFKGCIHLQESRLPPHTRETLARETSKCDPAALIELMREHTAMDHRERIKAIREVDCLNVVGGESGVFPRDGLLWPGRANPDRITNVLFEEASHWLYIEYPDRFVDVILDHFHLAPRFSYARGIAYRVDFLAAHGNDDPVVVGTTAPTLPSAIIISCAGNGFFKEFNSFVFHEMRSMLPTTTWRTVLVASLDLTGHGETGLRRRVDNLRHHFFDYALDILSVLDDLRVTSPFLLHPSARDIRVFALAHSMGANSTLHASKLRPSAFSRIFAYEPAISDMELPLSHILDPSFPIAINAAKRRARFPNRPTILNAFRGRGVFATWDERALELYARYAFGPVLVEDVTRGEKRCELELRCLPLTESENFVKRIDLAFRVLHDVQVPVLVAAGENSKFAHLPKETHAIFRNVARRIPKGEFVMVLGADHSGPVQKPRAIAELALNFFLLQEPRIKL